MTYSHKIAIIGAGISGLSTANLLHEKGYESEVYESKKVAGGLVSCTYEEDHLFHRVGGHVFNSKDSAVHDWFWRKFDKETEFLKATRKAAIYLDSVFVKYPIELSLDSLPPSTATKVIDELIAISAQDAPVSTKATSFRDFLVSNFGQTLCDLYFLKYNTKIWNRDLREIPLGWLDGKLPMTKPNEIIIKNIIKASDDMVHSFFFYPVRGGSQFIVDRLAESTTIKNEKVSSISHSGKGFIINQDDQSVYSSIVFTGSIRDLASIIDEDTIKALELNLLNNYEQEALDFNGTSNLLCECDENDYSWIYLPEPNTKFHRIIMTGNFSPNNNSPTLPKNRTTCTVEVSGYCKREDMEQSITSLPFNLKPIAYNYCENSYIIHNHKTKSLVSRLTSQLENKGIYCCGRFAEWKYYNMDAAIASAMQVTAKIHSRGVFQ